VSKLHIRAVNVLSVTYTVYCTTDYLFLMSVLTVLLQWNPS